MAMMDGMTTGETVTALDRYMDEHPKARVSIRGPQGLEPLARRRSDSQVVASGRQWWLSLTDEEGDAHDFKGPTLRALLSGFAGAVARGELG